MRKSRRYISLIITALVVAWMTFGDCIFPLLTAIAGKWITNIPFYKFSVDPKFIMAFVFWLMIQNSRWGTELISRSQTYIGLLAVALGTIPICAFAAKTNLLTSFNPGYILLALCILAAKVAIWRFWWKWFALGAYEGNNLRLK